MKELTRAEEQVMQVLWRLGRAFVRDIIEELPGPAPAYNTVSTIVRILEKKGFVTHAAFGKSHEYVPLVSRDEYKKKFLKSVLGRYFGGSLQDLVSFFAANRDVDIAELEALRKLLGREISKHRGAKR